MNGLLETAIVPMDFGTVNHDTLVDPELQPNKRRRKKSEVWNYFTPVPVSEDCTKACCNQCNRSFAYIKGKKQSGTSHLKRHIDMGICPANRQKQENDQHNGAITARPRKRCRASPGSVTVGLDQEHCIHEIAKMILGHDYPPSMVQQPGFFNFVQTLQPHISVISFESIQNEILGIYGRQKNLLANILAESPGRVSLTLDLWTSDQTLGYAILTGHFVDADWKLQRRVLNFVMLPFPDSQVAFNHPVVKCLSEWALENKLFAVTLDQSFANESVVGNLRGLLSLKRSHLLNGQLLIVNCYARVISRLAQEALVAMEEAVGKVRDSVKFVKTSESREHKFMELRQKLRVPCTRSLVIDNKGKWDSTYHMLSTACELKEVFSCLDTSDTDYTLTPTTDDWRCIEVLCAYLKLFFDGANILMAETYPTANKFFHNAHKIQYELAHGALRDDPLISDFVRPLYEKFDKYWRECCVVLAMVVVMDPRFKLKVVEFNFESVFGAEAAGWVATVKEVIHDLFFEYVAQTLPLPYIHVEERYDGFIKSESCEDEAVLHQSDPLLDFDVYIDGISSTHQTKSELDQYLEDTLMPREEMDVMNWWKLNRIKYPILSKMAADLLSVPFATLHRESVFDTERRKLDGDRSSLRPGTVEAIVCANNWFQYGAQPMPSMLDMRISPKFVKMESRVF